MAEVQVQRTMKILAPGWYERAKLRAPENRPPRRPLYLRHLPAQILRGQDAGPLGIKTFNVPGTLACMTVRVKSHRLPVAARRIVKLSCLTERTCCLTERPRYSDIMDKVILKSQGEKCYIWTRAKNCAKSRANDLPFFAGEVYSGVRTVKCTRAIGRARRENW